LLAAVCTLLASVASVASVASAPASAPASAAVAGGRPVFVYGDSVLLGAKTAIEQRLSAKGWRPSVFAQVGANMPEVIDLIRSQQRDIPNVVVMGAGNNYFGNPTIFREQIDTVMSLLGRAQRVIWLNLREFRPDRRDANAQLAAAAQRWPTLEIADWNKLSSVHPEAFYADGLHLRPAGAALMAQLVDQRLDAYLAGEPAAKVPVIGNETGPLEPRVYAYGAGAASVRTRALLTTRGLVTRHSFVGIASTPTGRGYWLAGSDGGVFTAGDAAFRGSAGNLPLARPIVGIASTRTGRGYWLVASDGGVFAFGDAQFHGSTGNIHLNQPVVGITPTATGRGYWLVASDGGVFAFGDARFRGAVGHPIFWPVVGMVVAPGGAGYWLVAADGTVYRFGGAPGLGSRAGRDRADLFIACAARPGGYWLLAQRRAA
jgi:hypothetical protein